MNPDRTPPQQMLVEDLLPHREPMVLIDRLLVATEKTLHAVARVPEQGLFEVPSRPGSVLAAAFGLEAMAQAIAAWDGYWCLIAGQPIRVGLILGVRDFRSSAATFAAGTQLQISAEIVIQTDDGVGVFDCVIDAGPVTQSARLTVLTVRDLEDIQKLSR